MANHRRLATLGAGFLTIAAGMAPTTASATPLAASSSELSFQRVSTFSVSTNNENPEDETVAEIIAATSDGRTLVYTDGVNGTIGIIDIADPADPLPQGVIDVGGEPTSLVIGDDLAFVGVNTSESYTDPSGHLAVVDLTSGAVTSEVALGGQPDSVAISPDKRYVAIAIENERDEEACADGLSLDAEAEVCLDPSTGTESDLGELPQGPAGNLQILDLSGPLDASSLTTVDLTGLADYAPGDPEPEFVDINLANQAAVTLQENNHVVLVDLASGTVTDDFSAGTVTLDGIDATEDDMISMTETLEDVRREPDSIAWMSGNHLATANEGDLFGGSRGFTVWDANGEVDYDSGVDFDHLAAAYGMYPESRSENKGSEPESVEFARFGRDEMLFVGSERGNFVAVYDLDRTMTPTFSQLLPTGLGPEGLLAIPGRDLLVVSSEVDDPPFGVRATVSIYQRGSGAAGTPDIVSASGPDGLPIPWSALSGLTADPSDPSILYAVWDSYYSPSHVFTIDVSTDPATVISAVALSKDGEPAGYDLEGITLDGAGGYWLASEGNVTGSLATTPNLLVHTDGDGVVLEEVGLPDIVEQCRTATVEITDPDDEDALAFARELRYGFEGVTVDRLGLLHVAQQRGWTFADVSIETEDGSVDCATLSDSPGTTNIWTYDPAADSWSTTDYELEATPEHASWVGLSEVTALNDGTVVLIERDNRTGDFAERKTLVRTSIVGPVILHEAKQVFDLIPAMRADNGWISDKPEGFAVAADGSAYVVSDNDGVDGWNGETQLLRLGPVDDLFIPKGTSVALIGDVPYGGGQPENFGVLIDAINADPNVAAVIHNGDTKSGSGACTDEYLLAIRHAFDTFVDPVSYTPGDNEWTDCHRENNGGWVPTERLDFLRANYFGHPGVPYGGPGTVAMTQAALGFPENQMWSIDGVLAALIHVVGSNNNDAAWFAGTDLDPVTGESLTDVRQAEVAARVAAGTAWMHETFDAADANDAPAVLIVWHGNLWAEFENSSADWSWNEATSAFVRELSQRAADFGRPVLIVTGDSHDYYAWQPFSSANTHPLAAFYADRDVDLSTVGPDHYHGPVADAPNVTHLVHEVWDNFAPEPAGFGAEDFGWLELTIDPSSPGVFSWLQHTIDLPAPTE